MTGLLRHTFSFGTAVRQDGRKGATVPGRFPIRPIAVCLLAALWVLPLNARDDDDPYLPEYDRDRLEAPRFSVPHGYCETAFRLEISAADADALIYYTLDGSEPTTAFSKKYQSPIEITGTTVVRARVISREDSHYSSRIATATYLFVDDVLAQGNTPEGYPSQWGPYAQKSGNAIADYEMDPELMADPDFRAKCREGLLSLPVISLVTDRDYIFGPDNNAETGGIYIYTGPPTGYTKIYVSDTGEDWIRPTSVEMFNADSLRNWQVDCGLKLHGGHSRLPEKNPKHSFRLKFTADFGPRKLKYPLFDPDDTAAGKLDNIVLRAGFGNTWTHTEEAQRKVATYTRDAWTKKIYQRMGHPSSHTTFAHLFINGLYWGIYTPTEHLDAKWCETYFGDTEEDYDIIKVEDSPNEKVTSGAGSMDRWKEVFTQAASASSLSAYRRLQGLNVRGQRDSTLEPLLDVDNFIDYMILNIYIGNTDWDNHNWLAFRNQTHPGTGFRMLVWDSERILEQAGTDVGYGKKRHEYTPSYLFESLLKSSQFCQEVDNRISRHCYCGVLQPDSALALWNDLSERIATAIYAESARWGDYRRDVHSNGSQARLCTVDDYYLPAQAEVTEHILPGRRDVFVQQMRRYLSVTALETPAEGTDAFLAYDRSGGRIILDAPAASEQAVIARLSDLSGRSIRLPGASTSDGCSSWDVGDLPAGCYLFSCRLGDTRLTLKFLKP